MCFVFSVFEFLDELISRKRNGDDFIENKQNLRFVLQHFHIKVKQSRYRPGVAQRVPGS
jgi:hypothetical protein